MALGLGAALALSPAVAVAKDGKPAKATAATGKPRGTGASSTANPAGTDPSPSSKVIQPKKSVTVPFLFFPSALSAKTTGASVARLGVGYARELKAPEGLILAFTLGVGIATNGGVGSLLQVSGTGEGSSSDLSLAPAVQLWYLRDADKDSGGTVPQGFVSVSGSVGTQSFSYLTQPSTAGAPLVMHKGDARTPFSAGVVGYWLVYELQKGTATNGDVQLEIGWRAGYSQAWHASAKAVKACTDLGLVAGSAGAPPTTAQQCTSTVLDAPTSVAGATGALELGLVYDLSGTAGRLAFAGGVQPSASGEQWFLALPLGFAVKAPKFKGSVVVALEVTGAVSGGTGGAALGLGVSFHTGGTVFPSTFDDALP